MEFEIKTQRIPERLFGAADKACLKLAKAAAESSGCLEDREALDENLRLRNEATPRAALIEHSNAQKTPWN